MQKPRMKIFKVLSIISFCLLSIPCFSSAAKHNKKNVVNFQVGVILDRNSTVGRIGTSCLLMALSDFYHVHSNYTTRVVLHFNDSKEVIDAAASGLHLLRDEGVDAIIGPQKSGQANFVINLGDKAHVPIISFSATNPFLPSKSSFFVQTAVSDDAQAGVIAAIVKNFQWNQVVMIYEDSDYGNGITSYLSNSLLDANARISYRSVIPVSASDDFLHIELLKMMTMQTRVFVVHLSEPLATQLFLKARDIGMMDQGYVWIVSSSLMDLFSSLDSRVMEAMHGVIGVKPLVPKSEKLNSFITRWKKKNHSTNMIIYGLWAYDTLWALAMAAERLGIRHVSTLMNTSLESNLTMSPFTFNVSNVGLELRNELSKTSFDGLVGKFYLKNGKLGRPPFEILNVVEKEAIVVGILEVNENENPTGPSHHGLTIKELKSITWPGNSTIVPKGHEIPVSGRKLRVGVPAISGFDEFCKVEIDPQTNATQISGYYIDLFNLVMQSLPYDVRYEFVHFENSSYDGLVQQVFLQKYDAVVGDITITTSRSNYVDFALPFAEGGFMAIVPIKEKDFNKWDFLNPLNKKLWLTSLALLIYTGFAVWFLEHRINPNFRGSLWDQLGKLLFFPFMTIVFAHREKIVGNLTRVVVMVWVFVVLILTSSYIASLSSTLTIRMPEPSVRDVSELLMTRAKVGCRDGSFMYNHLIQIGFNKSQILTCKLPENCNDNLVHRRIEAFFGVVPYIKLFLCTYKEKYMIISPLYRTDGYAYAFPRGSPLVSDVSRAITELSEKGKISEIEKQWSNLTYLGPAANVTSTTVKLESFGGLFAITGSVTTLCVVLFFANYVYENKVFIMDRLTSSTSVWTKINEIWSHFNEMEEGIVSRRYKDTPTPSPRAFMEGSSQIHSLNTDTGPYLRSRSAPNATP